LALVQENFLALDFPLKVPNLLNKGFTVSVVSSPKSSGLFVLSLNILLLAPDLLKLLLKLVHHLLFFRFFNSLLFLLLLLGRLIILE
jgi:hypothetical protein